MSVSSKTTRTIWKCSEIDQHGVVTLAPVYNQNKSTPNWKVWDETPKGTISLPITHTKALEHFEQGKEYYVDFSPVE